MTEQEIVQAWKQNDRYWASPNITDEMRRWADDHKEDMHSLMVSKEDWCRLYNNDDFYFNKVYRLRPDYTEPEEEIIEVSVKQGHDSLVCESNHYTYDYVSAPSIIQFKEWKVSFAGYKYADGEITIEPIIQKDARKNDREPIAVEFPVSVLFRRVK